MTAIDQAAVIGAMPPGMAAIPSIARMDGPQAAVAAMTIADAAIYTGLGRSRLYEYLAEGRIIARKAGRRTILMRADLDRLLAELPRAPIRQRTPK